MIQNFYNSFMSLYVLEILFPSLNENKNAEFSWGCAVPQNNSTVFGTNHTCSRTPRPAWILPNMQ